MESHAEMAEYALMREEFRANVRYYGPRVGACKSRVHCSASKRGVELRVDGISNGNLPDFVTKGVCARVFSLSALSARQRAAHYS